MSSVGSSDSSKRNDEVVRRNREETQKSEAEILKKHKKEIRRLNEAHFREVEKMKENHAKQMEALKNASNDAVSARDHRYQKEIDGLRGMHRKQLEQTADENQRREELVRGSIATDSGREKEQNDVRFKTLAKDYTEGMRKQEERFQQSLAQNREAQQEALAANREKLEKTHNAEKQRLLQDRQETVGKLQTDYSNYRSHTKESLRDQELRHMQEKKKASNDLLRSVQKERSLRTESEGILRDGFEDGLDTVRARFEDKMKQDREALSSTRSDMKSTAMNRIENQVRRLENEKEDLKETKVRNELQLKQKQQREIANLRESWGKNIENYREQRDEAVRQSNQRNAKDVGEVRDELTEQLTNTNRFYRNKMDENNRINRNAYEHLVGDFESRQQHTKAVADQRVKQLYEMTAEEKARLIELQTQHHSATQRQKQDEMKALREHLDNDKQQAVIRLQDQIRKQELQHSEKLSQVVAKYEKQLVTLKDQVIRERKLGEENLKRTVDELSRAHKVSIDQLEAKNRDRMRTLSTHQAEEIRSVNKRHENKLDQVLTEIKKT